MNFIQGIMKLSHNFFQVETWMIHLRMSPYPQIDTLTLSAWLQSHQVRQV